LSKDFIWELEKLRRRFGVDGDELQAAAKRINRKRRGEPPFNDDKYLAKMRDGDSARQVAESIRGTFKDEIRISRKNRRTKLRQEYSTKLTKFVDRIMLLSEAERIAWIDRLTEATRAARLPEPHLMLLDISDLLLRKVLEGGGASTEDTDNLERARFHLQGIDIDPDSPRRRIARRAEIEVIDTLIGELQGK